MIAAICLGAIPVRGQPSQTPDPKFWTPDGPVNAILLTNGIMYLGGDFSYVGPRTGPGALFDASMGALLAAPPRVYGILKTVVSDGDGGWFVGGTFTRVGNVAITNLIHLQPDLSLDTSWNARVVGTAVNSLVLDNGRLYVGGQFTRIQGQTISGLAALIRHDATLDATWNPQLSGTVNAMEVNGDLLYVGGNFFNVGPSNRQNLAAISTTTALANEWNPAPDQQVFAIRVSGSTVYAGGQFTIAGTKPRSRLAAFDAAGVATTWNPNPNGIVRALALAGSSVYVGGDFTLIGGQNRRGFGAVNSGNGAAQTLNLQLQSSGTANLVRSLELVGDSLYVGGSFTNALGEAHPLVVGVDLTSGLSLPVPLGSEFNGASGGAFGANALAYANETVFVGGDFQSVGGVPRERAAALSLASGAVLPWAPAFSGPVLSMAFGTHGIYVGGSFTNLNLTNSVRGLASVDPLNGTALPFEFLGSNQFADVVVRALAITPDSLYVGGAFTSVGGQPRRFLAALNPETGAVIPEFNANLGGGSSGVSALALAGPNLYLAGDFTSVNAVAMPRLAAVSPADGTAVSWNPGPNQPVTALAATADSLYVGGNFSSIDSVAFRNFAAFSLADHSLLGVDASLPAFAQGISAIAATPTVLYVGGSYDSIGGEFRLNLASLASFNASSFAWDPAVDQPPAVIVLNDELAAVGGPFRFLGRNPTNQVNGFLAVFHRTPQILETSLTVDNRVRMVLTTGDRTEALVQATPDLDGPNPTWTNVATNDFPGFPWTIEFQTDSPQQFFRGAAR